MCKSSAGPGRNNAVWKLSVFAPCQPATRYPSLKNIPSRTPMAASFSDSPPLTPSGQETAVRPRSQRAQGPSFFAPRLQVSFVGYLLRSGKERQRDIEKERGVGGLKFVFLICSKIKKPTYSSLWFGLFLKKKENMTRISPAHTLCRRHKPCSRQPCVLTVDFESELRLTRFFLFFFYSFFYFILRRGCEKVATKTHCPLGCRHVFVLACFCVPSHCDQI